MKINILKNKKLIEAIILFLIVISMLLRLLNLVRTPFYSKNSHFTLKSPHRQAYCECL